MEIREKAEFAAAFLAQGGDKALFVGFCRQAGYDPSTQRSRRAKPAFADLLKIDRHLDDIDDRLWFDLKLTEHFNEFKGRLVVQWPRGRLWWRWAKSNEFRIHAIYEESFLDSEMPSWDELSLTWKDLSVLPTKWRIVLSQWRGIYYIFDVEAGKGYVGSAYGKENILGRWEDYAKSGHGGNKKLIRRDPHGFVFTILQRTSPDLEGKDVVRLETSWKDRLHTRDYGLNDN